VLLCRENRRISSSQNFLLSITLDFSVILEGQFASTVIIKVKICNVIQTKDKICGCFRL
jgi:hypothetical protein